MGLSLKGTRRAQCASMLRVQHRASGTAESAHVAKLDGLLQMVRACQAASAAGQTEQFR